MTTVEFALEKFQEKADPDVVRLKKERFGIVAKNSLGLYQKDIKEIAHNLPSDNVLALALFDSGIYEAKLLCRQLYRYQDITPVQMEAWVTTFENWEICDSFVMSFMAKTPHAVEKALEWSTREPEFEKRAGFVMMAAYGSADKKAPNEVFEQFFPVIQREATDERIYVKKAVNWALRNIGKRNQDLRQGAIATANQILQIDSKTAQWIAKNALKELESPTVKIQDYPRHLYR